MSFWLKVLLFWPFVTYAKEHQRCLRHIDALERDLFPEWFPMPGWGKAEIEEVFPAAMQNYTQIQAGMFASVSKSYADLLFSLCEVEGELEGVLQ